jgi:hypothetical protein
VDFWRKPPPLIGFGVERHTLAYRRYHPGISSCISGAFCEEGAAWPRRAQAIGEILRSAVDRGPDCRSIPTQWRASQGASIEPVFIRFRRWNLAERPIQLFRAHACRTDIWLCMQGFFIRSGQILPTHFTTGRGDRFELHSDRFRRWNLAERPIQLFRAHACRTDIWLCMQGFFIRSGQILPTHFTTGRGDRFELHSDRFRRWNLLGRIQCPRRGANPPGFQI